MDFTIDDEQKALRSAVRGTLSKYKRDDSLGAGPQPFNAETWQALVETGVPALIWPESDGGFGAGMTELAIAAQELGARAIQTPLADVVFAGVLVQELGSDEQRAELLGGISDGSVILLPALDQDKPVRFAQAATHVIVRDGDQLYVVKNPTTDGDSVKVDASSGTALGSDATQAIERAQNVATAVLIAESLGAMEAALAMTVDYLKTRKQFGVPLMVFQALTHRAADMYTSVELARSTAYFAAMTMDENRDDSESISRAKVITGKAGRHVGQEAIQLHGGIGMTAEYDVGHLSARLNAIEHTYGGTREHLTKLSKTLDTHESVDVLS